MIDEGTQRFNRPESTDGRVRRMRSLIPFWTNDPSLLLASHGDSMVTAVVSKARTGWRGSYFLEHHVVN